MSENKDATTLYDLLYGYQARLQGVANDLAVKLAQIIARTDDGVLNVLKGASSTSRDPLEKQVEKLQKIVSKIERTRLPAYKAAEDLLLATSADVAKAGTTQTEREFNAQLRAQRQRGREARFVKTLDDKQLQAIIDGQGISGETIRDWFHRWRTNDIQNLARLARRASVESLTIAEITRLARGVINGNGDYVGVLKNTKVDAARMARTIVNGVSNNARIETIRENADVIDGIRFVGTLDGKTCPYCASYDGYIWRGEDMATARRPPIHPNCRCTIVPVVELKDAQGNPVTLVDENGRPLEGKDENGNEYGLRPAANADFDALAKDAYNAQARAKGWERRWDDLAPATRLRYYYKAQKDFERRTGKPAYRQVPSSLTFKEYFEKQPDSFKRAWLGARAYEQYKSGTITNERDREKILLKPDLSYRVDARTLQAWQSQDRQEVEELEKLAAPDKEYVYEPFVWEVDEPSLGFKHTFVYGDETRIPEILGDATWKTFTWLNDNFKTVETLRVTIEDKKPKRDDYSTDEKFNKAYQAWEDETKRYNAFVENFIPLMEKYRWDKLGKETARVREWAPLSITLEKGVWKENAVPEWASLLNINEIKELRSQLTPIFETLWSDVKQKQPLYDDYFGYRNYKKAVKMWEDAVARVSVFKKQIENYLDARVKELENQAKTQRDDNGGVKIPRSPVVKRDEKGNITYSSEIFAGNFKERSVIRLADGVEFRVPVVRFKELDNEKKSAIIRYVFTEMTAETPPQEAADKILEIVGGISRSGAGTPEEWRYRYSELSELERFLGNADNRESRSGERYYDPELMRSLGDAIWQLRKRYEGSFTGKAENAEGLFGKMRHYTGLEITTARGAKISGGGVDPVWDAFYKYYDRDPDVQWEKDHPQKIADTSQSIDDFFDAMLSGETGNAPAQDETPPAKTIYTDPQQVVKVIDEWRVNKYGAEEAERRRAAAVELAQRLNDLKADRARLDREYKAAEKEYNRLKASRDQAAWLAFRKSEESEEAKEWQRLRQECEEARLRLNEIGEQFNTVSREYWTTESEREKAREESDEILRAIFPDNGGGTFLDDDAKNSIIGVCRDNGYEREAEKAVEFYDLIGRTYNTENRRPVQFTFELGSSRRGRDRMSKNTGGDYNYSLKRVRLNRDVYPRNRNGRDDADAVLIHELGHWLEQQGLGTERATKNVDWLVERQEYKRLRAHRNAFFVPNDNAPNLCARMDNYAQRVYPEKEPNEDTEPRPFDKDAPHRASELISVGMEYLYRDPEMFILRHPEHFRLILENLSEY